LLLYTDDIFLYRPIISKNDYNFFQENIDSLGARSVNLWPVVSEEKEIEVLLQLPY